MSGKVPPLAAFCEEYDEDAHESLPQTRQVANRLSLQKTSSSSSSNIPPKSQNSPDGASDSGYSSRTFASSQSALSSSGAKSPPLTLDSTSSSTKTTPPLSLSLSPPLSSSSSTTTVPTSSSAPIVHKKSASKSSSSAARRDSHRRRRSGRDDPAIMQVGSYPSGPYHGSSNRSPSRSRGGGGGPPVAAIPPYGAGWDYDPSLYHPSTGPSTPIEPLDYSYYLPSSEFGPPGPPPPPPMPPSTQTSRYSLSGPPPGSQDPLIVPHSSRPSGRSGRANTYQAGTRPLSFHGGGGGGGAGGSSGGGFYNPAQYSGRYDYGPPLSASAYSHSPSFGPSAYGPQPPFYSLEYGPQMPEPQVQPQPQHRRDRSMSRSRDYPKARRGSMYGPPLVDNDPPTPTYEDGEPLERGFSRDSRPPPMSPTSSTYDHNDDYYRMPPPPPKPKSTTNAPQIIQKRPEPRKMATTSVVPRHDHRRNSKSFDMTDMDLALPDRDRSRGPRYHRSRENLVPERSRSIRNGRRPSQRDPSTLPSRLAVEGARRRRAAFYHYDDFEDEDEDEDDVVPDDEDDEDDDEIEEKQREAEQYQAAKIARNSTSNKPTPLTEHALTRRAKSTRTASDSSSQKSHSNSSRASDPRTHSCSHVGSNANTVARQQQLAEEEAERNKNITMTMNGVTMSFNQESVGGKSINLRASDTGALELNIGGGKKPKKYLTSGSEYAGTVARREIEDAPRHPRDGRRSEKASRRSSRSTYSGRF